MTESTSFWSGEPLPSEVYFPFIADAIILVDLLAARALITEYSSGKFHYPISGRLNRFQKL
jgi:hypothetical protein